MTMTTRTETLPDTHLSGIIDVALGYFGWSHLQSKMAFPSELQVVSLPVLMEMALEEIESAWLVRIGERACTVVGRIECCRFKQVQVYDVWEHFD